MQSPRHSLHRPSRQAAPPALRIERWQRRAVYLCIALLTVSGLTWLMAHYFFRPTSAFGETVSPFEPWSMKLHGAAVIGLVFFVGSILNGHIRRAVKSGRNRYSGWALIVLLAALTLSGYGLYYVASESTRPLWSVLHWLPGCVVAGALALHVFLGRRAPT